MTETEWSVSGLCITARPERLAAVEELLNGRPGLEVHAREPHSGRLIAVQECRSVAQHTEQLLEIQKLPGVLTADLVCHYSDSADLGAQMTTGGIE